MTKIQMDIFKNYPLCSVFYVENRGLENYVNQEY